MKKVMFSIIILGMISIKSFSQPKQGSISVGGTFSIDMGTEKNKTNNTTSDGPKTTYFALIPSVEYFIADKFSAGLGIGYSLDRSKTEAANTTTINSTGTVIVNPFARMYFSMGEKVSLFGQGEVYLGLGKKTDKVTAGNNTTTTKLKDNTIDIGIRPGVSLFLSDKISIEATFGFIGFENHNEETDANSSTINNDVIFSVNPSYIGFGIRFFIN